MSELATFIANKLHVQRRKQIGLTEYLAEEFHKSVEAARKWITGRATMPYEAVEPIATFLDLKRADRVELYRLAGYPLPDWHVSSLDMAEHGGMREQECTVVRFNTMDEVYAFATEQIDDADESVCDLTWGHSWTYTQSEWESYDRYMQSVLRACDRQVRYREVMSFDKKSQHYFKRAKNFLKENKLTYNLGFYEPPFARGVIPPLMSFLIVDKNVAVMCLYSAPNRPPDKEIRQAFQHPQLIEQLQDYFDEIWREAIHLKSGDEVNIEVLKRLNEVYGTEEL